MGNEHASLRLVDRRLTSSREEGNNDLSKRRFSVDVTKIESRRHLSKPSFCQSSCSSSIESGRLNAFKQPRQQARAQSSNQLLQNYCWPTSPSRPLSPTSKDSIVRVHPRRMSVDDTVAHPRAIAAVEEGAGLPHRRYSRTIASNGKCSGAEHMLQGSSSHRRFSRPVNATSEGFSAMDGGLCLGEQLKLSSYQTLMLQQTWPRIKSTVFSSVFRQLTQKNIVAKELFQKMSIVDSFSASKCCNQKEHVQLLVELFEACIQELNSPCKIAQLKCLKIGEVHFGVSSNAASVWDDLGDCLTESISKAEAVRGKREAFRAWIALISFLIDSMKAGYMAQSKRKSVSTLSRLSNGQIVTSNYGVHPEERIPSASLNRKEAEF